VSASTALGPAARPAPAIGGRGLGLGVAFAAAAGSYWLSVFPRVCGQLSHWRTRAQEIPDPVLRDLALAAQRKRGNCEGAAAFAAFAPRERRAATVRSLVAFQSAYNYLDMLAEQPHSDPVSCGRRLHEALLVALDPQAEHLDYYEHYAPCDDGGYLRELVETCREALAMLPSYRALQEPLLRSAERIVAFQSLNLPESHGEHTGLESYAREQTPPASNLRWWETAGAAGSSLGVHALIAACAQELDRPAAEAIERAYFPWIGALHSLLDNLVDRGEDEASGQRNLIGYYSSPEELVERLRTLAQESMLAAAALPDGSRHLIMLNGMAGFYLSAPQARSATATAAVRAVRESLGPLASPTSLVFAVRRAASRPSGSL
jgi:tetraprenyl-beta-curcumene synthase